MQSHVLKSTMSLVLTSRMRVTCIHTSRVMWFQNECHGLNSRMGITYILLERQDRTYFQNDRTVLSSRISHVYTSRVMWIQKELHGLNSRMRVTYFLLELKSRTQFCKSHILSSSGVTYLVLHDSCTQFYKSHVLKFQNESHYLILQ